MAIRESFLREIWGVASFGAAKASNLQKFSAKIVFSPIHKSFLPRKFPAIQYVAIAIFPGFYPVLKKSSINTHNHKGLHNIHPSDYTWLMKISIIIYMLIPRLPACCSWYHVSMDSTNLFSVSSSRLVRGSEELSELGSVAMSELELEEIDPEELLAQIFCSEFS